MKSVRLLALTIFVLPLFAGCAQRNSYEDPTYNLQRDLHDRNERFDNRQNRRFLRRKARDDRYNAWFNSVME